MDMIGEDSEDDSSLCPDSSGKRSFYKVNKFSSIQVVEAEEQ